jgi:NADPH:quinone reductase-like Zn-dependent oxidoreductase
VALLTRQVRLQGMQVGNRRQQIEMIRALDHNNMKPVIDRTYPLQDLIEAFRYEASGAHFGKICIEM